MFLIRYTLLTACLVLFAGLAHSQKQSWGIAAKVAGKGVVTTSEVQDAVAAQSALLRRQVQIGRLSRSEYESTLKRLYGDSLYSLIERELILGEFGKIGGSLKPHYVDEDIKRIILEQFDGDRGKFLEELKGSGISMRKFRKLREKMLIVQMMRHRETGVISPPTPAQREAYLKKHEDKFREKAYVKLRTITILKTSETPGTTPEKQRKVIEELRSKLANGADFATVAKTYSEDSRGEHGGDWGWIDRETLKKELSDVAFDLPPKRLSKIVEDNRSFFILYVEAKRPGALQPMEEIQGTLEKLILQEERKKRHDAWVSRLWEKSVITDGKGKAIPPKKVNS
jgi:peptidyl-prolyl cis-trans isomerase SurA